MSTPVECEAKVNLHNLVDNLLGEQSFVLDENQSSRLDSQIEQNHRYIAVTGIHEEGGIGVNRFIKIPAWESGEMEPLFKRQVIFSKFLKKQGIRTREIIAENLDPKEGLPFAIMETFDNDVAKVGLISQFNSKEMLALTPQMAHACITSLTQLHEIRVEDIPRDVVDVLRDLRGSTDEFFELMVRHDLEKRVIALDTGAEATDYASILDRRLGVKGFHKKVLEFIGQFKQIIKDEESKAQVLFHGDYSPDNLYFHDDNTVELLDLEWAGIHDNEAIAMIIDYGNLRARVWNNIEFRESLDSAIMDKYRSEGREDLGKAVVALGILRSDIEIGGAFENYPVATQSLEIETQRRASIEQDITKAFELAGITLDINQEGHTFSRAKGISELLAEMEDDDLPDAELLKFNLGEDSDFLTAYNPSPMEIDGETYLWVRVEDRRTEEGASAILFKEDDAGVWNRVEGAPVFDDLQDPFYCGLIDGQHVLGGVKTYHVPDSPNLEYRCAFYILGQGESLREVLQCGGEPIEPFALGPERMKGIRLIQLEEGRIGVFTRPQGDFGGRGKMGYFEIEHLADLSDSLANFNHIKDPSTFVYGLFIDDEWGGPNELHLMADGRIRVLGHMARFGKETYTREDGIVEAKKDYLSTTFIFDPITRSVSDVRILATIDRFPQVESKKPWLGNIEYTGGLTESTDPELFWLYVGLGDTASARKLVRKSLFNL